MKKGIVKNFILAGWALLSMAGCTREPLDELFGKGEIAFDASSTWLNDEGTRTEYSGKFTTISGDGRYERIDWVQNTDLIRVYCKQAFIDGSTDKYSDYKIASAPSAESQKSVAQVAPASTGNTLRWGSGTHTFYALYPAPGTKWNYDNSKTVSSTDATLTASGDNAIITGSIPTEQVVKKSGSEYKPNMNYAYMYAIKQVSARSSFTLSFKPLVTAIQFTLRAGDSNLTSKKLSGITLKSNTVDLSGNFKATLTPSGGCTIATNGGTFTKQVHVTLSDQPSLSTPSDIKITFFTLAVNNLTQLSIVLSFTDGSTRTLELKNRSGSSASFAWTTVTKCCKAYINSLTVPGTVCTYTFGGTLSDKSIGYTGGSNTFATGVTSSRTNGVRTEAVSYTIQYNYNGTWVNSPPDWLSVSGANTSGGTSSQSLTATINKRPELTNDSHHTTLAGRTAKTNFDLSTLNVATGGTVSQTTANCYVVTAPGTYKFPLVYGNARKNGANNEDAYHARNGVGGTQRNSDATSAPYYLGYFKNHANSNITQPYIGSAVSGTLTPAIIWTDEPDLVQNVAISGSGSSAYMTFSVPKEYITQGNALLAVKSGSTILWSWHIWVTDANLTACKQGPTSSSGAGSTRSWIAPLNIGWCDGHANDRQYQQRTCQIRITQSGTGTVKSATITQTGAKETNVVKGGNCPFYQWGRKDPLPASDGTNLGYNVWGSTLTAKTKTYYYSSGYSFTHTGTKQTIGTSIQNPTAHYSNGSNSSWEKANWCSTDWLNMWSSAINNAGNGGSSVGNYANAKTKTIYDPSPVGFRVPSIDVYEELSTGNTEYVSGTPPQRRYNSGNGYLYYPLCGQRAESDGKIGNVGYYGLYWSSMPYGDSVGYCGFCLYMNPESSGAVYTWNPDYTTRRSANGLPVRPVKE